MKRRWIVSVGVDDYGAQSDLPNLPGSVVSSASVFRVFQNTLGFDGVLLATMRGLQAAGQADLKQYRHGDGRRSEIIEQVSRLSRVMGSDDDFVLYYSGHSDTRDSGSLLPYGAIFERSSTHLLHRTLCGELRALPCRSIIVILDVSDRDGHRFVVQGAGTIGRPIGGTASTIIARTKGVFSPEKKTFAAALSAQLKALTHGSPTPLAKLVDSLRRDLGGCEIELTYEANIDCIRPGDVEQSIIVPSLSFAIEPRFSAAVGEDVVMKPDIRSPGPRIVSTSIESAESNCAAPMTINEAAPGEIRLRFERDGQFRLHLVVAGEDGMSASRLVSIDIEPRPIRPLAVDEKPLRPCEKGAPYAASLRITGGTPPYTLVAVEGLPGGLAATLDGRAALSDPASIEIRGVVPETPSAAAGRADASGTLRHCVTLRIRDGAGTSIDLIRRLFAFSRDEYVRIEKGESIVGYLRSTTRDDAIRKVVIDFLSSHLDTEKQRRGIDRETRIRIANNESEKLIAEVKSSNPGSLVTLGEYYIRKYPVTNGQWREFVIAHQGDYRPRAWTGKFPQYFPDEETKKPIVGVKIEHIRKYLDWRGTRFPTAWEWERAARGTDGRLFPWGDEWRPDYCNAAVPGVAHPARLVAVDTYDGKFESSTGVRDIVGNAAEWVERRIYGDTQSKNDVLIQPFRGGSFVHPSLDCITFRDSQVTAVMYGADEDQPSVGDTALDWLSFRDVVDLDPSSDGLQALVDIEACRLDVHGSRELEVQSFKMAIYAVSNDEFLQFTRATHRAFPGATPSSSVPFPPSKRHLPVVRVSYRDALEFCLWKSRELSCMVRLPTFEQWRAAATGAGRQSFPWGDDADPKKCNFLRSGWGQRLPVWSLPEGRSKEGIAHLIGNVWQWITPPAICGGSWRRDFDDSVRIGYRMAIKGNNPEFRSSDIGFRYVVLSSE